MSQLLLGAAVGLSLTDLVANLEVLRVARRAMAHVLPLCLVFKQVELGRAHRQLAYSLGAGTALAIRVWVGAQDRVLQFFLDTIPLLLWRFRHLGSPIIMARPSELHYALPCSSKA